MRKRLNIPLSKLKSMLYSENCEVAQWRCSCDEDCSGAEACTITMQVAWGRDLVKQTT
jgi:hypothetical protein